MRSVVTKEQGEYVLRMTNGQGESSIPFRTAQDVADFVEKHMPKNSVEWQIEGDATKPSKD